MADRKLHGSVLSPPTLRVAVALYEKELEFEFVAVDMRSGAHKHPSFLAKNPFGQVPVLEDCGISLFESRAITQYLAQTYREQGTDLSFPTDNKHAAAELVMWIQAEAQQFDQPASKLIFELKFKAMFGMGEANQEVVAEHLAKLTKVLDVYEARLAHKAYLSGDSFGLADLHHMPALNLIQGIPTVKKLFDERPHVCKWAEGLLGRPSWAKVLALQKGT